MEQLNAPRGHVSADHIGKYLYDETFAALMGEPPAPEIKLEDEEDLWNS